MNGGSTNNGASLKIEHTKIKSTRAVKVIPHKETLNDFKLQVLEEVRDFTDNLANLNKQVYSRKTNKPSYFPSAIYTLFTLWFNIDAFSAKEFILES